MACVGLRGVCKSFGAVQALHGIELDVGEGEFMVLVGPSGSGKTTVLRIVAGLERVSAGQVLLDGDSIEHRPAKDRDMAMVFQQYALYPHMTVRENLGFSLKMRNATPERIRSRVAEVAEVLGLAAFLERRPGELSGGQQQRVAIGRAIVRQPRVFLFDEPLSNLDGALRSHMRTELKTLQRRLGTTSIYVTHDQTEAMAMADRIAVVRAGRIEQIGTPLEVYDRPSNLFVAGFIGVPPMNLVPGKVLNGSVRTADGTLLPLAKPAPQNAEVIYGFRPEACDLSSPAGVPARISAVEHLGPGVQLYAEFAGKSVCIFSPERQAWRPGATVRLRPDPDRVRLFDAASGGALATDGGA